MVQDLFYDGAKQSASPVAPIMKNEKRTKRTKRTFVGHRGSSKTVWLQTTRPLSDLQGSVEATD